MSYWGSKKCRDFWDKAEKCKHENAYPDYLESINCTCGGYEFHCKDCGAYVSECRCGEQSGMSGWPHKRHKRL